MNPDAVISVDKATITRGGNHLIRAISWQVELDERWVVLGPNGAGKTSLLNLASARVHPMTRDWWSLTEFDPTVQSW